MRQFYIHFYYKYVLIILPLLAILGTKMRLRYMPVILTHLAFMMFYFLSSFIFFITDFRPCKIRLSGCVCTVCGKIMTWLRFGLLINIIVK